MAKTDRDINVVLLGAINSTNGMENEDITGQYVLRLLSAALCAQCSANEHFQADHEIVKQGDSNMEHTHRLDIDNKYYRAQIHIHAIGTQYLNEAMNNKKSKNADLEFAQATVLILYGKIVDDNSSYDTYAEHIAAISPERAALQSLLEGYNKQEVRILVHITSKMSSQVRDTAIDASFEYIHTTLDALKIDINVCHHNKHEVARRPLAEADTVNNEPVPIRIRSALEACVWRHHEKSAHGMQRKLATQQQEQLQKYQLSHELSCSSRISSATSAENLETTKFGDSQGFYGENDQSLKSSKDKDCEDLDVGNLIEEVAKIRAINMDPNSGLTDEERRDRAEFMMRKLFGSGIFDSDDGE